MAAALRSLHGGPGDEQEHPKDHESKSTRQNTRQGDRVARNRKMGREAEKRSKALRPCGDPPPNHNGPDRNQSAAGKPLGETLGSVTWRVAYKTNKALNKAKRVGRGTRNE